MNFISQKKTPEEIHKLKDEFEQAMSFISDDKQKYYHVNSVRNFINSVSLFVDAGIQEQVFNHLQSYIDFISNNVVLNTRESLSAYNIFLKPITKYYEIGLGFTIHVKPIVFSLALLLVVAILYLFHFSIFLSIAVLILIIWLYLRNIKKSKQKKAYAFLW